MEFVFHSLPKYDRKKFTLSDWLTKLEHRFVLAEIEGDSKKIKLCQFYIGQTDDDILEGLANDATWQEAKDALA